MQGPLGWQLGRAATSILPSACNGLCRLKGPPPAAGVHFLVALGGPGLPYLNGRPGSWASTHPPRAMQATGFYSCNHSCRRTMPPPIPATLIAGDGIGPEIVDATLAVLDALNAPFVWDWRSPDLKALTWRVIRCRRPRWTASAVRGWR